MKNARFWIFYNGDHVKLTLEPGQTVSFGQGGPDDEGWHYYGETIELSCDGAELALSWVSDGADCDGRLTRGGDLIASADPADFIPCYEFDGRRPDWQDADAWQRDQYAEAMGY